MSKLQKEVSAILDSVKNGTIEVNKTASETTPAVVDTETSGGLRKLAHLVRSVDTTPSYDDIFFLLKGDN